jgi:hypothetical protein
MKRSYSELQHAGDIAAIALSPTGLGRPTMSRAGWSPVGGEDGGHVEMAISLISTIFLEIVSNWDLLHFHPDRHFYGVVLWSHKTAT